MSTWLAYVTVFVAAAIPWLEVLLVVPAGIVAGLPPVPTAVVGAAGNAASLVPLVFAGDRVRSWWRTRRSRQAADGHAPEGSGPGADGRAPDEVDGRGRRARRVFDRFGLPGLALLGPLLTGVHVAALVGLAAGADRRPTLFWLLTGVVLWAAVAAAATVLGLDLLVDTDHLPDLFAVPR